MVLKLYDFRQLLYNYLFRFVMFVMVLNNGVLSQNFPTKLASEKNLKPTES